MLALYTFLTWAPLFVKNKFGIPFEEAGNIITQYWGAALVGALVSTGIVARVKIHYFLLSIILLACVITTIIVTKETLSGLDYLALYVQRFTTRLLPMAYPLLNAPAVKMYLIY